MASVQHFMKPGCALWLAGSLWLLSGCFARAGPCLLPIDAPVGAARTARDAVPVRAEPWPLRGGRLLLGTPEGLWLAHGPSPITSRIHPEWLSITADLGAVTEEWVYEPHRVSVCDTADGAFLATPLHREQAGAFIYWLDRQDNLRTVLKLDRLLASDERQLHHLAATPIGTLAALSDFVAVLKKDERLLVPGGQCAPSAPNILATASRTFVQWLGCGTYELKENPVSPKPLQVPLRGANPADALIGAVDAGDDTVVWDFYRYYRVSADGEATLIHRLAAGFAYPFDDGYAEVDSRLYFLSSRNVLAYQNGMLNPLLGDSSNVMSVHELNGDVYVVRRNGVFVAEADDRLRPVGRDRNRPYDIDSPGVVVPEGGLLIKTAAGAFFRFTWPDRFAAIPFHAGDGHSDAGAAVRPSGPDKAQRQTAQLFGTGDRVYLETDESVLFFDAGRGWVPLASAQLMGPLQLRQAGRPWAGRDLCRGLPGASASGVGPVFVSSGVGPLQIVDMPLSAIEIRYAPALPERIGPYAEPELLWTLENAPCATVAGAITQAVLFRGPGDAEPEAVAAEVGKAPENDASPAVASHWFAATLPDTTRPGDYSIAVRITDNATGESVALGRSTFSVQWSPWDYLRLAREWAEGWLKHVPRQAWVTMGVIVGLTATYFIVRHRKHIYRRLRYRWWRWVEDPRAENQIFISYRSDDAREEAFAIEAGLQQLFGESLPFLDKGYEEAKERSKLMGGEYFEERIMAALEQCAVVLALIGPDWLDAQSNGRRRLQDPDDFVRRELQIALAKGKLVIPIRIRQAPILKPEDLPADIQALAALQYMRFNESKDDTRKDREQELTDIARVIASSIPTLPPLRRPRRSA